MGRAFVFLADYWLPLGLVCLLSGMFWIGDRSDFHRLFYGAVALPTLVALILRPGYIVQLGRNTIFLLFMVFAAYMLLSLGWAQTDNKLLSLFKRPLYIAMLFYAAALVALSSCSRLESVIKTGVLLAALSAALSLGYFYYQGGGERFDGYGALYNPLLTSHVYGMFAAMALAWLVVASRQRGLLVAAIVVLLAVLLATGSRTPLVGLFAAVLWIVVTRPNRAVLYMVAVVLAFVALLLVVSPENITSRGLSYRPQIWHEAWLQIVEKPWLGHGFDHKMVFRIAGIETAFADPHNMLLAVLFSGGVVGLGLWLALYGVALWFAWRNRQHPLVLMASAALVFGFFAGMTEGNSFLSRPKEHWFLIWIPMALLAAVAVARPGAGSRAAGSV